MLHGGGGGATAFSAHQRRRWAWGCVSQCHLVAGVHLLVGATAYSNDSNPPRLKSYAGFQCFFRDSDGDSPRGAQSYPQAVSLDIMM